MEPKELEPFPPSTLVNSSRWWSKDTVAIVTGANRGIGYAIVKRLAELGLTVILTARDSERGFKASETLRSQGLNVQFSRLDVSDAASIEAFVSWFRENFAGLNILKNCILKLSILISAEIESTFTDKSVTVLAI
ncbi:hypothetical protein CRG98_046032 [Punica granatum]|uniref:(+)-neomenthol dehydrogenase-like n=1 Tax=Punica granatum TaxID=22663 RepID=A0A2I0HQM7_PUNGR|nr:hypothetical protein CRG98_046032 [Punica granatum]